MTDIIMKHFHLEAQMILALKVMQFCSWLRGSITAFLVCLDSLGRETLKLINLPLRLMLLYGPSPFVDRQCYGHLSL